MLPEQNRQWENHHDIELLKRYLKGDDNALSELYQFYYNKLAAKKFKTIQSQQNEEDAFQNAFLLLLDSLRNKKNTKITSLRAWLITTEENYLHTEERIERPLDHNIELANQKKVAEEDEEWEQLKGYLKGSMRKALLVLPAEERKIIVWKYVKKIHLAVIAKKMKTTENNISQKAKRTMEKLKKLIAAQNPSFKMLMN